MTAIIVAVASSCAMARFAVDFASLLTRAKSARRASGRTAARLAGRRRSQPVPQRLRYYSAARGRSRRTRRDIVGSPIWRKLGGYSRSLHLTRYAPIRDNSHRYFSAGSKSRNSAIFSRVDRKTPIAAISAPPSAKTFWRASNFSSRRRSKRELTTLTCVSAT